jgi:catechol 2,3-dioxygenase-like lactoylglutathione lyase family enzyme
MNSRKIYVSIFFAAILLCIFGLGQQPEQHPLTTRVEHFFLISEHAQSLFTFFRDTFELPEVWPFFEHGPFSSGGLSLGNAVLEFVSFPKSDNKPLKTAFRGIAFEPTTDADPTAEELAKRNIPHLDVQTTKSRIPGGEVLVEWSTVTLSNFPPISARVFFCDYKDRQAVAQGRRAASRELAKRMGGPLGIVGAAEITLGVQDLAEARKKWSALLAPSPRITDDAFVFYAGPRIRLVHAESPGIQGIVLKVRSLDQALKFLHERGLLVKDDSGRIAISPVAIDGLSIRLMDGAQGQESANPLLGHGRGLDHIGIGVLDLEKATRDYEQVLGFKCTEDLPSIRGGNPALRSLIFFRDETLLEFLSPPRDSSVVHEELRRWVEKHEGAMSLALRTSSAKDAVAYLEAHNFDVKLTEWPRATKEWEMKPSRVQYYSVSTPDTASGNKQIFMVWIWLIENVSPERSARLAARREQGLMAHPNTAVRLHAAWFAVRDLDASLRNLQDAGLELDEPREAKFLGAQGREVKAGSGVMLLLRSADKNGALNKFLSDHDDGDIFGISIEVSDLNKARSWVEGHSGHKLEPYNGFYGPAIMVPPDLTHGVWLELFERRSAGR